MGMVIGIDVGGSTTKIIGVDKEGIKHPMIVKAEDPITSLFGAFGKYSICWPTRCLLWRALSSPMQWA